MDEEINTIKNIISFAPQKVYWGASYLYCFLQKLNFYSFFLLFYIFFRTFAAES